MDWCVVANEYFVGNEGVFTFPVWPIKTIILIGCVVTAMQFLVFVRRYLTVGDARPKAEG